MGKTIISILTIATIASAVQVDIAPAATGYIYRSDNNGPASLIQLGAHSYVQPQFAPLPLAQPLKLEALEAYDLAPVPLPYVAAKSIAEEDSEDDDDESDESYEDDSNGDELAVHDDGHSYEKGAGNDYEEKHHHAKGEKGSKGYHTKGHHAKGEYGHYAKKHGEGSYDEAKGEKGAHHDEADAYGKKHAVGKSYKGGDHGHKKHSSKGEEVTGYHKVFNKNEYKKDHDFYDVADDSGKFNKHGHAKEHHGAEKGGHKKGGHHDAAAKKGDFGKSGSHAKGHIDNSGAGHSAEEGHDSHYNHQDGYGKKGGSGYEKEYTHENDGDDDEDDDEKGHDDKY